MIYTDTSAVISECGQYRYLLRRTWDVDRPVACLIMLNPSTADASKDDATILSCVRLLTIMRCDAVVCAWGCHQMARRQTFLRAKVTGYKPYCFGVTKDGSPKHPLYLKSGTPLVEFK